MNVGQLSKDFYEWEFACRCGCGYATPNPRLVWGLQRLRDIIGEPLNINSGCRCAEHNRRVGGSVNSQHLTGKAADVWADIPLMQLYRAALLVPEFQTGGIGVYPEENFLHVDVRGTEAQWGFLGGREVKVETALTILRHKEQKEREI